MHVAHYKDAATHVDYGAATSLLPVEDLDAQVWTHRDAERVLTEVAAETVVAVRPTGLATSYAVTWHPLTAVDIESLDDQLRETVAIEGGIDLGQFELLQIGWATTRSPNRSLSEF